MENPEKQTTFETWICPNGQSWICPNGQSIRSNNLRICVGISSTCEQRGLVWVAFVSAAEVCQVMVIYSLYWQRYTNLMSNRKRENMNLNKNLRLNIKYKTSRWHTI